MSDHTVEVRWRRSSTWPVVAAQEMRDLWLSGRALMMVLAQAVLLSVSTYLVAINQELNFLEQREAVSLTLQLTVAAGSLLVVLAAADTFSGERERGSLETLLLTPTSRPALALGKGVAALSLWLGAFAVSLPYLWWLGRDVGTFGQAVLNGALVGTLLSVALVGLGVLVSMLSGSNGVSLAVSFFVLLALYAPSQMPVDATRGWAGELLRRADPFSAATVFLDRLVVQEHTTGQEAALLLAPVIAALLLPAVALVVAGRVRLMPGGR